MAVVKIFSVLMVFALLAACDGKREFSLSGRIVYKGAPVEDAEVQAFLKETKDKDTPPVRVVATDMRGAFVMMIPKGKYYLVSRKKLTEAGEVQMLTGSYADNPVVVGGDRILDEWQLASKKEGGTAAAGTGIEGQVTSYGSGRNVRVYLYGDTRSGLKGPDHVAQAKIDGSGRFRVNIGAGSYHVTVRERRTGNAGPLREGDRSGVYQHNPVVLSHKGYADLGLIKLVAVDSRKVGTVVKSGINPSGGTVIAGHVVNAKGTPVKNMYVLAYGSEDMVGRPAAISSPSSGDGRFRLLLTKPGRYFIGARSRIGGPAEPGEMIGSYTGSVDKSVVVAEGEEKNIRIEVSEVW